MNIVLIILICLIWLSLGFIGFIIEARRMNYERFDKEVKDEFLVCIFLGVFTFTILIGIVFYDSLCDWFDKGMNKLLYKINGKNNKK